MAGLIDDLFTQSLPAAAVNVPTGGQTTPKSPVKARITGTFLRKNAISLNDRIYTAGCVDSVVAKAQQRLQQVGGIPLQMLAKHESMDEDESGEVVGRITDIWLEGDLAKFAADMPVTKLGEDYATLIDGGFINTVSLRSEPESAVSHKGTYDDREVDVIEDFDLAGIDFTLYPGIRDVARVETIQVFESVDPSKLGESLTETVDERAAIARSWYESWLPNTDTLGDLTIDVVERDWVALSESAFARPGKYTKKDRSKIPPEDFAGPHKTFPIVTQQDVHDAARLIGHARNPDAVKARVIAIAKRKGFALPKAWQSSSKESTTPMAKKIALPRALEAVQEIAELDPQALAALAESLAGDQVEVEESTETVEAKDDGDADDAEESDEAAREDDDDMDEAARESALRRAHDAIASALKMACMPGKEAAEAALEAATENQEESAASAADGAVSAESARELLKSVVREVMGEIGIRQVEAVKPAPVEAKRSDPKPPASALEQAVALLLQSQAKLIETVAELKTTVPAEAAKAAASAAWRPKRATQVVENSDAGQPQSAASDLQSKLADRSVPVEQRLKIAAEAFGEAIPFLTLQQQLGG